MSSRRSRQQSSSSRISDEQIIELVSKLRQLVPEIRHRRSDKVFQNPFKIFNSLFFKRMLLLYIVSYCSYICRYIVRIEIHTFIINYKV